MRRTQLRRGTGFRSGRKNAATGRTAAAPCPMCRGPLEPGSRWYCAACQEVRALVLARDSYACVCCGKPVSFEHYSLGHRLRASQGGRPVPSNLITLWGLGGELHHGRIDLYRDPEDEAKGYRLRSGQDPAQIPVMVFRPGGPGETVWLDDLGNYLTETPEASAA